MRASRGAKSQARDAGVSNVLVLRFWTVRATFVETSLRELIIETNEIDVFCAKFKLSRSCRRRPIQGLGGLGESGKSLRGQQAARSRVLAG